MKTTKTILNIGGLLLIIITALYLLLPIACSNGKHVHITLAERNVADSIAKSVKKTEDFAALQKELEAENDQLGCIAVLRAWGKSLRDDSRFDEALSVHSKGLKLAETINDTIEWVRALNNIGTDYRRMGMLDVAQEYHYKAWKLSEKHQDTTAIAKKNLVVSLNGLGNIYMTLGNYERADSALRMALEGEKSLGSSVGQAINCANIGSIFERQGRNDSAWVYFLRSMEYNREAGDTLGISLCYTFFGSLYEKERKYDKAIQAYETAYKMMQSSKDEWHSLNTMIALAGIYNTMGNMPMAQQMLAKAKAVASKIQSKEHLAEIYTLYYKFYKKQGDAMRALENYEYAETLRDSVTGIEKMNRIQNTSLNIERNLQARQVDEAKLKLESERTARKITYAVSAFIVLALVVLIATLLYIYKARERNHRVLKNLITLREHFFTNITHEFRTPLTVILGLCRDLQGETQSAEKILKKIRTIERQGENLLVLINQLLDISKIKSEAGEPDWHNGSITTHIGMIIEGFRDYARSKNIVLQYMPKNNVEMDFVPEYINKMINNLLSNAFKFTPEYGRININVWSEKELLFIEISDTGTGIPKESIAHVFEAFYQAERTHIGTGIGLRLVKQIVDSTGGTITVDSIEGTGTTFRITLPINNTSVKKINSTSVINENIAVEQNAEELPAEEAGEDNEQRLLIIEDNRDVAEYIGSQLSPQYAIFYAFDGQQGFEKAIKLVPDLIITDLMMPQMDGLELCRQIRKNNVVSHIPIIVITAKITAADRVKGLEAGADAYLSKPFYSEELQMRVEKLLEQRRMLHEKFANAATPRTNAILANVATTPATGAAGQNESDRKFLIKVTDTIYMQLNKDGETDVNFVASQLCMSYSQFYRKISAITGCTPLSYFQRVKIRRACNLLDSNQGLSLGEVAEKCGFNDYSNFVRSFKNVCGITPTEYRRQAR